MEPLFPEQEQTVAFMETRPRVFDMSDPGTGKTRGHLQAFANRRNKSGGKALVVAPKTILQPAWGDDIDKFFPGMMYSTAYSTNRAAAFQAEADIYITNHDAVKWLVKNLPASYWKDFDTIMMDESTAFKHRTSERSKAIRKLVKHFEYRENMTGTPNPNGVTDLWHQALLLDDGERLGTQFWKFRSAVQEPVQVGPLPQHVKWTDKDGAEAAVFDMLRDITIRHALTGVPENRIYPVEFELPRKVLKVYREVLENAVSMTERGEVITAIHAASLNQKLLQIASGAVYTGSAFDDNYAILDDSRTELVMDLIEARAASVVVFIWRHQREQLVRACMKRGFPIAVIDGTVTNPRVRTQAVADFQVGKLKAIIVHPQSAGHGLTLTRGKTTIFVSPTYNAEHYKQVYHRIVRRTQTERTETIHVVAKNTIDQHVYDDRLGKKLNAMQLLLDMAHTFKEAA